MSSSVWPVIVHRCLNTSDIVGALGKKQMKIRFSESIIPNTVIFPLSGVAFMILPVTRDLVHSNGEVDEQLVKNVDKFIHVHGNCYILLKASLHGKNEQELLSSLQHRYLSTSLQILPVHNISDIVQAMLSIAKLLCKPTCDIMSDRFKTLMSGELFTSSVDNFCKQLNLDQHQIQVTKDRLGSLSNMATASYDQLLDCSLDSATVNRILSFFNNKS